MVPFLTPYTPLYPRLEVRNPRPKLQSLLSQEQVKLRTSNLASYIHHPSKQKPINNFGEKGAWAYPGTARLLGVPPIITGIGKATNLNFVPTFTFARPCNDLSVVLRHVRNCLRIIIIYYCS